MEPMIARAFLYRLLSPQERDALKACEARLPPRRYLQGFEGCRMFRLEPSPKTEIEIQAMNQVAATFGAILWKRRILEYRTENPSMSDAELTEVVDGKIEADDIGEWQAYAAAHYTTPMGAAPEKRPFSAQ